jgi:hypothetical protein
VFMAFETDLRSLMLNPYQRNIELVSRTQSLGTREWHRGASAGPYEWIVLNTRISS